MAKSLGNYNGVSDPAEVMFKKVMEVPDKIIIKYFELATDEHPDEIGRIKKLLQQGVNPRDVKFKLAEIITNLYWGEEETKRAISYFETAFSKREIPENIPELLIELGAETLKDIIPQLIEKGIVKSKGEFIRLIKQKGVQINKEKIGEDDLDLVLMNDEVLQIGKKRFIRLIK